MRAGGGKVLGGLAGRLHRAVQRKYSKEAVKRHDGELVGDAFIGDAGANPRTPLLCPGSPGPCVGMA